MIILYNNYNFQQNIIINNNKTQQQIIINNKQQYFCSKQKMSLHSNNIHEKWIKVSSYIEKQLQITQKQQIPFIKCLPIKILNQNQGIYSFHYITSNNKIIKKQLLINPKQTYQALNKNITFNDMCNMNILNQPEILNNIIQRYNNNLIFTYIGPTLIITNPYKYIKQYFDKSVLNKIKDKILKDNIKSQNLNNQQPHVYIIAGKAFLNLKETAKKQAIVISGQSGAGKTESTKYCMEILTSLSNSTKHSIQQKIISCNPLLQAFGNSKTVRNDNSSRFGKYVQIFFGSDNKIKGANIQSYLLQKSRIVSIAKGQRTFHSFYALIASGMFGTKQVQQYNFLKNSQCYVANNINDNENFKQIIKCMIQLGFTEKEQIKIWNLLKAILELGNIQFENTKNLQNQANACELKNINKEELRQIAQILETTQNILERILIYEKKNLISDIIYKPYLKNECIANRNTLCKTIYNTIFEFIIKKIQLVLNPKNSNQKSKSINILDIFGFQNFQYNSFQQLCINYTNQKLLKLYNEYIFKRQMQILIDDDLLNQVNNIKPPTNNQILCLINHLNNSNNNNNSGNVKLLKNVSIFSIINDITLQQQYTDMNIKNSLQKQFGVVNKKTQIKVINFCKQKNKQLNIILNHTQCVVQYDLNGFKMKNMDKINDDIQDIIKKWKIINPNMILNQNSRIQKQQKNKTLLKKFDMQIQNLINQLQTSNVHFIRCIKPNDIKKSNYPNHKYLLTQIRYLGVFQTIQIRKMSFPIRYFYKDFLQTYKVLFTNITNNNNKLNNQKKTIQQIFKHCLKLQKCQYMIGSKRVYINEKVQLIMNQKLYQYLRIRNQHIKRIQKVCKRFIFTSKVSRNIKNIVQKKILWKNIAQKYKIKLLRKGFQKILQNLHTYKINIKHNQLQLQMKKQQQIYKKIRKQNQLKIKTTTINSNNSNNNALKQKNIDNQNIQDQYQTVIVQSPDKKKQKKNIMKNQIQNIKPNNQNTKIQYKFNDSFYQQESLYVSKRTTDSIFNGNLKISMFQPTKDNLDNLNLLKSILNKSFQPQISSNSSLYSSYSEDSKFQLEDNPVQLIEKIIEFPIEDFFLHVLRKRKGLFGIRKSYQQVLSFKAQPLTKSLTDLQIDQEEQALKIFKLLIKIGSQTLLQKVFDLVDDVMRQCEQTTESLKNQVFLQLIKQSNNKLQVPSIRIYQTMSVFLHIYTPDQDFLYAGLSIYFKKLKYKKIFGKQEQFLKYLCKKMIRKILKPYTVGYMPIKYQLMALMSKKQISIPIYFPIGNNITLKVQPYQTFADIKNKVLVNFGINIKRIPPQFFGFFEVLNYQNIELQQSPLNQSSIVWDIITYWQLVKQKYSQAGKSIPYFFFMMKIKYPFSCTSDDQQTIQIYFAQCYFDYSMGRIRLDLKKMAFLAACIKKVKIGRKQTSDIQGCFPQWMTKFYDKQIFKKCILENIGLLQQSNLEQIQIKYKFLQVCSQCPLAMTFAVPTESVLKLFFKPKRIYIVQKGIIIAQFTIRQIAKWSNSDQSFNFVIRKKDGTAQTKTHMIMTEYSIMCTDYLNKVSQYLLNFGGRIKKQEKKFLKN